MLDVFRNIKHNTILLEVEILEPLQTDDYSALDQLVGICETGHTDASVNHDTHIYERRNSDDLR